MLFRNRKKASGPIIWRLYRLVGRLKVSTGCKVSVHNQLSAADGQFKVERQTTSLTALRHS